MALAPEFSGWKLEQFEALRDALEDSVDDSWLLAGRADGDHSHATAATSRVASALNRHPDTSKLRTIKPKPEDTVRPPILGLINHLDSHLTRVSAWMATRPV